jgi:hypothetical protein
MPPELHRAIDRAVACLSGHTPVFSDRSKINVRMAVPPTGGEYFVDIFDRKGRTSEKMTFQPKDGRLIFSYELTRNGKPVSRNDLIREESEPQKSSDAR